MNAEKWKEIVGRIEDSFDVLEHETEDLDPRPGRVEFITFIGPKGRMRLERESRPRILEKKGLGSRRIGSQTSVEYIYSDSDEVDTVKAFSWDESREDWAEISLGETFGNH